MTRIYLKLLLFAAVFFAISFSSVQVNVGSRITSILGHKNTFYLGTEDGYLLSISTSGGLKSKVKAFDGPVLDLDWRSGHLYALGDGKVAESTNTLSIVREYEFSGIPFVLSSSELGEYLSTDVGVYLLSGQGKKLISMDGYKSGVAGKFGKLFFVNGEHLYSSDSSGSLKSSIRVGPVFSGKLSHFGSVLPISTLYGAVIGVDMQNFGLKWKRMFNAPFNTQPVVIGGSTYALNSEGLYKLSTTGGIIEKQIDSVLPSTGLEVETLGEHQILAYGSQAEKIFIVDKNLNVVGELQTDGIPEQLAFAGSTVASYYGNKVFLSSVSDLCHISSPRSGETVSTSRVNIKGAFLGSGLKVFLNGKELDVKTEGNIFSAETDISSLNPGKVSISCEVGAFREEKGFLRADELSLDEISISGPFEIGYGEMAEYSILDKKTGKPLKSFRFSINGRDMGEGNDVIFIKNNRGGDITITVEKEGYAPKTLIVRTRTDPVILISLIGISLAFLVSVYIYLRKRHSD